MTTLKKPASAGRKAVAKSSATPRVVEGVSLTRLPMEDGKPSHPAALFKGQAPALGDILEFTLANGVTYRGEVADATDADGEVLAEFAGPLSVVPKE